MLIIHSFDGPDYGVIRPASVASSGDGKQIIDNMIWSSWTATAAHADATREIENCSPSCAEGTITPMPITFDLSDPVDGHFTKVVEIINGESTTITDDGLTPGDLGFVGAILGASSQSLATPESDAPAQVAASADDGSGPRSIAGCPVEDVHKVPVLMIYPDGAPVYAVICPINMSGAALQPQNITWDRWTATEAVGTGTTYYKEVTGEQEPMQTTITMTDPVNGAFSTFTFSAANPKQRMNVPVFHDPHYKAATPDSARVPIPCTC